MDRMSTTGERITGALEIRSDDIMATGKKRRKKYLPQNKLE